VGLDFWRVDGMSRIGASSKFEGFGCGDDATAEV
jgi:hypothetical protein